MTLKLNKETLAHLSSNEATLVFGGSKKGPDTICTCQKNMGPTYDAAYTCVHTDNFC